MKTLTIHNIMALGVAIQAISCAGPKVYKLHDGAGLPQSEAAVLVNAQSQLVYVDEVDGKKPEDGSIFYGSKWNGSFRIELKPGPHTLLVRYYQPDAKVQPWKPAGTWDVEDASHGLLRNVVSFDAQPGKTYTITKWDLSDGKFRAWVGELKANTK